MTFQFRYINHRGENEIRTVRPIKFEWLSNPGWGYTPGWFLTAFDYDRGEERSFRIDGLHFFPLDQTAYVLPSEDKTAADLDEIRSSVKALADKIPDLRKLSVMAFVEFVNGRTGAPSGVLRQVAMEFLNDADEPKPSGTGDGAQTQGN
jgi:hypothetical protein